MKVKVNINAIGKNVGDLIKEKLRNRGFPECLGNMSPPIVQSIITVEDSSLFCKRSITPPENIVEDDISDLVVHLHEYRLDHTDSLVLDINGKNYIEEYKDTIGTAYVDRLIRCTTCDYEELCSRLTTFYLKTISLKESL